MEQLPLIGLDARACYRALKTRDARFDGRLFQQHLGASPITVAQTRRVLFAKQ